MARKALAPATTVGPDFVGATPADMAAQEANVRQMVVVANENAQAIALSLNYTGSLHPDALEEGIRGNQRRIGAEVFEIGTRLILLREQCLHGEFSLRLERLGFNPRAAQRLIQVTLKFSNASTSTHLQQLGQSKLLEMVVLDDDEITQLTEGGSARGITLDDVDCMSVTELRAALRKAEADAAATDKVFANQARLLADAQKAAAKLETVTNPWPEKFDAVKNDAGRIGNTIDELLGSAHGLVALVDGWTEQMTAEEIKGVESSIYRLGELIERSATLVAALRFEYDSKLAGFVADTKTHILEAA